MEDRLHEIEIQRALADVDKVCSEQVSLIFPSIEKTAHEQNLFRLHGHVQEAAKAYKASGCFKAIQLLKKAVLMCDNIWERNLECECIHLLRVIRVELKELTNKIRDSLIIRIQGCVQMGQREWFEHELVAQHGGNGITWDEWSQLMHSYTKQIRSKFPAEAFAPMRTKRKRRRPRKERS